MARQSQPIFAPERPGDVLRRCIIEGPTPITQDELAKAMGVSRLSVNQLIRGKRAVTATMALRLAQVLSTTPDFWLNLQRELDLFEARKELAARLKKHRILRDPSTMAT